MSSVRHHGAQKLNKNFDMTKGDGTSTNQPNTVFCLIFANYFYSKIFGKRKKYRCMFKAGHIRNSKIFEKTSNGNLDTFVLSMSFCIVPWLRNNGRRRLM